MLGTSFVEWTMIRLCILLFRYTPLLYVGTIAFLVLAYRDYTFQTTVVRTFTAVLCLEGLFYVFVYRPQLARLKRTARHPLPSTSEERRELFDRCLISVDSPEEYLKWWFLGADQDEIRRENVREFILWAFFERGDDFGEEDSEATEEELEEYIHLLEKQLGRRFENGWGKAESLRLTLDEIHTTYRGMLWYAIIFLVDQITHFALLWHGFEYCRRSRSSALKTFPPRPQELMPGRQSPAPQLSYWYKPQTDENKLPIVFFHGIGIGLHTYTRFLADVCARRGSGDDGVGMIAVEILPISFRLTSSIPDKTELLSQITTILDHHSWSKFAVVSHSYGSIPTTHMLHSPALRHRIPSVVLIDPVTIMLHLPFVAYNFTRRLPTMANEWQLWYFASTDPGVALCLGRHFFWRENIIWKEALLGLGGEGNKKDRKVTICLSGRDLIVDTGKVHNYLRDGVEVRPGDSESRGSSGIEVMMFEHLDHAQIFDDGPSYELAIEAVRKGCETGHRQQ